MVLWVGRGRDRGVYAILYDVFCGRRAKNAQTSAAGDPCPGTPPVTTAAYTPPIAIFFLGTHQPHWPPKTNGPLFVSRLRLADRMGMGMAWTSTVQLARGVRRDIKPFTPNMKWGTGPRPRRPHLRKIG